MSSGKSVAAIVLAVVGVLFLILGFVYLAIPAGSLPGVLGYIKGSTGHHALRMAASFVIAIICLAVAAFLKRGSKSTAGTAA